MNPMNPNSKDTVGTVDGIELARGFAVRFVSSGEYFDYILSETITRGHNLTRLIETGMNYGDSEVGRASLRVAHNRLCYEAGRVLDLETKYLLRMLAKILRMELALIKKEEEIS